MTLGPNTFNASTAISTSPPRLTRQDQERARRSAQPSANVIPAVAAGTGLVMLANGIATSRAMRANYQVPKRVPPASQHSIRQLIGQTEAIREQPRIEINGNVTQAYQGDLSDKEAARFMREIRLNLLRQLGISDFHSTVFESLPENQKSPVYTALANIQSNALKLTDGISVQPATNANLPKEYSLPNGFQNQYRNFVHKSLNQLLVNGHFNEVVNGSGLLGRAQARALWGSLGASAAFILPAAYLTSRGESSPWLRSRA